MNRKSNRSNVTTGTEIVPCPSSSKKTSKRVWDSIAAYTVQCAKCSKWRLIPSKEEYDEIRERIAEEPFLCETAREWRPEITCDDEPDLVKDGSWRWAIDKVFLNLLLVGNAFCDSELKEAQKLLMCMYYVAPSGKRLRSKVEVESTFRGKLRKKAACSFYYFAQDEWHCDPGAEERLALCWGRNSTPEAVTPEG